MNYDERWHLHFLQETKIPNKSSCAEQERIKCAAVCLGSFCLVNIFMFNIYVSTLMYIFNVDCWRSTQERYFFCFLFIAIYFHRNSKNLIPIFFNYQEKPWCEHNFISFECTCWKYEWKCEYIQEFLGCFISLCYIRFMFISLSVVLIWIEKVFPSRYHCTNWTSLRSSFSLREMNSNDDNYLAVN